MKRSKKKQEKFYKIYKIIVIIIIILMLITLGILYFFLDSYEKSIPTHQVDNVISWINNKKVDKIINKLEIPNPNINAKENIKNNLNIDKGKYFYTKSTKEYKKNTPVYTIYKDSKEIASVYLKKKSIKNIFNSPRFEIDHINGLLGESKTITIIVPSNSQVYVNNQLIDKQYIAEKEYKTEKMEYMSPYVTIDTMNKYVIDNLYSPYVKVNYNDKDSELINDNDIYTYKFDENQEVLNNEKTNIESFLKNYTKYVVKETTFGSITPYMITNSNAYNFLKKIALTNLWSGDHTPTTFSEFTYSNMQYYNDSAFSVEVSYTYGFSVNGNRSDFDTKVTLYLVKQNNKWYIVGLNT